MPCHQGRMPCSHQAGCLVLTGQDALFSPGRMPCSHPGRAGRPGARASFTSGVKPPWTNGVRPPWTNGVKPPWTNGVRPTWTNGVRPPWTNGVRPPWTSMKSRKKTGSHGLQGRLSSTNLNMVRDHVYVRCVFPGFTGASGHPGVAGSHRKSPAGAFRCVSGAVTTSLGVVTAPGGAVTAVRGGGSRRALARPERIW